MLLLHRMRQGNPLQIGLGSAFEQELTLIRADNRLGCAQIACLQGIEFFDDAEIVVTEDADEFIAFAVDGADGGKGDPNLLWRRVRRVRL